MSKSHSTVKGKNMSIGHVRTAAKLHDVTGGGWGFRTEDLTKEQKSAAELKVQFWANLRGYTVADLVTWMDTKSARHFVNYCSGLSSYYPGIPPREEDAYFPSAMLLRQTAQQERHGWKFKTLLKGGYELLHRSAPGEYVDGGDFEFAAEFGIGRVKDGVAPIVRTGGTQS